MDDTLRFLTRLRPPSPLAQSPPTASHDSFVCSITILILITSKFLSKNSNLTLRHLCKLHTCIHPSQKHCVGHIILFLVYFYYGMSLQVSIYQKPKQTQNSKNENGQSLKKSLSRYSKMSLHFAYISQKLIGVQDDLWQAVDCKRPSPYELNSHLQVKS